MEDNEKNIVKKTKQWCSVSQCKFDKSCSLHSFPKDKKLCKKWAIVCRIGKKITSNMKVCGAHFKENDFFPCKLIYFYFSIKFN